MRINLNDILFALSGALDCVEQELLGVTTIVEDLNIVFR